MSSIPLISSFFVVCLSRNGLQAREGEGRAVEYSKGGFIGVEGAVFATYAKKTVYIYKIVLSQGNFPVPQAQKGQKNNEKTHSSILKYFMAISLAEVTQKRTNIS